MTTIRYAINNGSSDLTPERNTLKLCSNIRNNDTAQIVLYECVRAIATFAEHGHDIVALILTGSFSRGEGSVLTDHLGIHNVLGDIEFLVLMDTDVGLSSIALELAKLERNVEGQLERQKIKCDVEFSPVDRNYLKQMRPSIFNYELKTHGKVVYGDHSIMRETVPFRASDIPLFDAFYLLCNRIVEQLAFYRSGLSPMNGPPVLQLYPLVKMYMDMAGSFLIMKGRYKPSYVSRCKEFSGLHETSFLAGEDANRFKDRLGFFTDLKIHPVQDIQLEGKDQKDHYEIMQIFRETCFFTNRLWSWEVELLQGKKPCGRENKDVAFILGCFSFRDIIIGWLKYIIIARRQSYALSWKRIMTHLFMGPPRILIYVAAAKLYFSLVSDESVDLADVQCYLPVECNAQSVEETIDVIIELWKTFIKSV